MVNVLSPLNSPLPEGMALFLLATVSTPILGPGAWVVASTCLLNGFLPCFAEGFLAVQLAFSFQLTLFLQVRWEKLKVMTMSSKLSPGYLRLCFLLS